jgi:hypothetical protein
MVSDLPRRWVLLSAVLSLISLAAAGCSSKAVLAEVSGVVMLNGKPMPDAVVQFLPEPDKGTQGPMSSGSTDVEGRFQLMCSDQRPGAVVGFHRVIIQDARSIPHARSDFSTEKPPALIPPRIASIYASAAGTPLRQEVKPGPQTVTIDVKSK